MNTNNTRDSRAAIGSDVGDPRRAPGLLAGGTGCGMTGERWQLLPDLEPDEYAALKADISANGLRVPVVIDAESGAIVDGHHRQRAVEELESEGVKVPEYRDVRLFADDDDRLAFAIGANLFRRHLSRTQRSELVARLRAEGWSLRRIAGVVGVDHKTVAADRLREVAAGAENGQAS